VTVTARTAATEANDDARDRARQRGSDRARIARPSENTANVSINVSDRKFCLWTSVLGECRTGTLRLLGVKV